MEMSLAWSSLGELNLGAVLGCRHFGDAVVEKWAALAGETVQRSGKGSDLKYGSETANTFLKHMREDQTLQATSGTRLSYPTQLQPFEIRGVTF